MSQLDNNLTFIQHFKNITDSLKKTFFRKPSFPDAVQQFSQLSSSLKREGYNHYAAFVSLAVARCHQALKNSTLQGLSYLTAGEVFWEYEKELDIVQYYDLQEFAEHAINCYLLAVNIYLEMKKFSMASSMYYELAVGLKELKRTKEAGKFYEKAAELQQTDNAMSAIDSLKNAYLCDVIHNEYQHGNEMLQWIIKLATEQSHLNNDAFYVDVKIAATVSHIFLLILQLDFQQSRIIIKHLQREHGHGGNEGQYNPHIYATTEWFFVLLDATVDAYEAKDKETLIQIHSELHTTLLPEHNNLFLKLLSNV
eukprot:TRINITY_DN11067_c0_g1_i1.p1 TRINITY_DN11067_c0_g1~~TRINITY_DN11067_c0_g1_i1.p1  ORF type:complete len:310 (-),score=46.84 TRINITY_DN11067_c0_g1_i1:27-956(-)